MQVPIKDVITWIWKGKSITRARMNTIIREHIELRGRILDLGGGRDPSYRPLLENQVSEWVTADIIAENHPTVLCDLEAPFPFTDAEFDCAIAFNLLEHVYHYQQLINDVYRVLKVGGVCHLMVPFLTNIHADPYDYFRYTSSSLNRIFRNAGFSQVQITPIGGLFQASLKIVSPVIKWKFVRVLTAGIAIGLDHLLRIIKKDYFEKRWVLMYWVYAKKADE